MITWVPFTEIDDRHMDGIAAALVVAPEQFRHSAVDIINALRLGTMRLFELPDGILLVHTEGKRLVIDALTCRIFDRAELADDLRRIAAEWLCDTVQTTVFDKRLADAIVKVGGRVESYDITLDVGTGYEHQEKDDH